jgi:hypothetical protein
MQKNSRLWFSFCILYSAFCIVACGCQAPVRMLRETPDGGVVILPNNSNQWPTFYRNRADYLMRRSCPDGYVIVCEEVAKDNPAARDGRKPNEDFEYNGAYQRISTFEQKAYLITFRRAATSGPAPPPTGKPAPPPAEEPSPAEEAPPPRRLKSSH